MDAYAIQAQLHRKTGPVGGYKIGCTTQVMQDYIGIRQPCAGGIADSAVHSSGVALSAGRFMRPGVECEIAIRLGPALPPATTPYTRDSVRSAVDAVQAAIEIVDDRYEDWRTMAAATLIADDFFNAGAVLDQPIADWQQIDLAAVTGWMRINGHEVGAGRGADILGHPLEALAWLANLRSQSGEGLPAGAFVLLGSIVQTHWVQLGDTIEIGIEGLGQVSARFV